MAAILERPARRHWSTSDVDSRHALAYWSDTICESFLEIDIDSLARDRFRARLDTSQFGPAMLHRIEADRQTTRVMSCAKSANAAGPLVTDGGMNTSGDGARNTIGMTTITTATEA